MYNNPAEVILTILFLLPGFICIFLPRKIIGVKLRHSNFELITLSFAISLLIITFSIIAYFGINSIGIFGSLIKIETYLKADISNFELISNCVLFGSIIIFTTLFFYIGMICVSKDVFHWLRKKMTKYKVEITPEKYVWDSALKMHKGHAIVQTDNDEYYLGFIEDWMIDEKEKEILLKYPEYIDVESNKRIPLQKHMGFDPTKIIFLDKDIKRIYLLPENRKKQ